MTNQIASMIDHTLLKAETTKEQVLELCEEAAAYSFASVCINPVWVKTAAAALQETDVKVCTVVGFPLGAAAPEVKAFETKQAIADGADEIDMVIAVGQLKSGEEAAVLEDMKAVQAAAEGKALTKVILETCLLTDEEKKTRLRPCAGSRARFCEDVHWLFVRSRDRRRCCFDAPSRRQRGWRESIRRSEVHCGCGSDDRSRCYTNRCECRHPDRPG